MDTYNIRQMVARLSELLLLGVNVLILTTIFADNPNMR